MPGARSLARAVKYHSPFAHIGVECSRGTACFRGVLDPHFLEQEGTTNAPCFRIERDIYQSLRKQPPAQFCLELPLNHFDPPLDVSLSKSRPHLHTRYKGITYERSRQRSPCRGLPVGKGSNVRCYIKTQWSPSDNPLLSGSWAALKRREGPRLTISHSAGGESTRKVFETSGGPRESCANQVPTVPRLYHRPPAFNE